ncbi:tyrosine-type recombinase/integrase [Shewanella sp. 0m-8]
MSLTKKTLDRNLNKLHDKPFELSDRDSLGVRVSCKGKIAWQYRFRFAGKAERLSLGYYPDLSLIEARSKVPQLKNWLLNGKNPKIEWDKSKNGSTTEQYTLAVLSQKWLESIDAKALKDTTYKNYFCTIRKWVLNTPKKAKLEEKWAKKNLNIPFDDISNRLWMEYFDWISKEGSQVVSGSVLKLLKTIVKWSYNREFITNSGLLLLTVKDVGEAPQVSKRTPSIEEIARMWLEIEQSRAGPQTKACLKLIILFGSRNSALRTAQWSDFNFEKGVWTIPEPKMQKESPRKGTHEDDTSVQKPEIHSIPQKAKEILFALGDIYGLEGYVFKGEVKGQPITIHAIDRFCSRLSTKLFMQHGISKIIPHDFRRSLMSILSDKNPEQFFVYEKMLGHKLQGTTAHYNTADYLDKQLEAYELYWSMIEKEISSLTNRM